jgi:hypothetical protein
MVKRTCIILVFLLVILKINFAYSSAWLQKPGSWGLYYTSEHQINSIYLKNNKATENKNLQLIKTEIENTENAIEKVKKNPNLTPQGKHNRLKILYEVRNLLFEEFSQNYIYYPESHNSVLIEHGLNKYLTVGGRIHSDYSVRCFAHQQGNMSHDGMELFTRVKLIESKKRIVSIQPKIILSQVTEGLNQRLAFGTEVRLLTGINRKMKKYNINHFTNLEFGYSVNNLGGNEVFISEFTQGLKFKHDWYLIIQNFLEKRPNLKNAYRDTLKEQISIAKSFKTGRNRDLQRSLSSEVTFQLGYFVQYSLAHERMLAEGIVFSLWLQM